MLLFNSWIYVFEALFDEVVEVFFYFGRILVGTIELVEFRLQFEVIDV
jgi:hypothetical protein